MALFEAGEVAEMRREHLESLDASYTRTPVRAPADDPDTEDTDESVNPWFEAANATGVDDAATTSVDESAAVTRVPCRFLPKGTIRRTAQGTVILDNDTLILASTDPLQPRDRVSALADSEGVSLRAVTAIVDRVDPIASAGAVIGKQATLVEGQAV